MCNVYAWKHRRRIELEDKAKFVESVWGDRILAALAALPRSIWNKQLSSTVYSKYNGWVQLFVPKRLAEFNRSRGKTASAARILFPEQTQRPLPCLLIQSFFYAWKGQCNQISAHFLYICITLYLGLLERDKLMRDVRKQIYFANCAKIICPLSRWKKTIILWRPQ